MDGARSGLGCDNKDHPSERPADEAKVNPCAAAEEDPTIAYLGGTWSRCYQSDSRDTVRLPAGWLEAGSCIGRTTWMAMGMMSEMDS